MPRLGALAVAALAIALAASASASTAAWQDNGVLPHLPAAHADPHYQPCIFQPHGTSDGSQHTVWYRFVSPDGTYGIGETITIRSDRIQGHGTGGGHQHSRLALETGDVDRFAVHSRTVNSNHLEYVYTVQPGDYSDDLDYRSSNAAHWRDPDTGGNHFANCWLSSPGTNDYDPILTDQQNGLGDKSLSVDRTVRVDGIIPRVEGVTTASGAYGAGSQANVTVSFGEPVYSSVPPPSLVLALEKGGNRTIPYLDGNETSSLVFNYTVRQGDLSDDLDYAGTGSLVLAVNGSLTDFAGNNASLALPEPGSPGSLGATSNASITAARGEAAGIDSPLPDGTYPAGHRIEVVVSFNEPVVYSGASPSLILDMNGANRTALYASGNNTRQLSFHYTVQPGDADADGLDYAGAGALQAGSGLRDRAGDVVSTALPVQAGGAGLLGSSRSIAIDAAAAAYVTGVDSPGGDAVYKRGDTVRIAVEFSGDVAVTGVPALALATEPPRSALYERGSGTSTLEFEYEVQRDDAASDLGYAGVQALSLDGGAEIRLDMQGGGGTHALLTLPAPGAQGSLGYSRDIAIDGAVPSVLHVSSPQQAGTYGTARHIEVSVTLDEPVVVEGAPMLRLATEPPRSASYAGGSGTDRLDFLYVVQPGDLAPRLGYADEDALALGGGASAIRDAAGNAANLTLPGPGRNGSLSASASIDVHGDKAPVIAAAGLITKTAAPVLDNPLAVAAFKEGNRAYAAVVSWTQKGVQLVQIHENGTLSAAASATDSQAEFNRLDGPVGVAAFDAGNYTYVMVATGGAESADGPGNVVQLIRVHENGTLDAPGTPSWLDHSAGRRLHGAIDADFFDLPGESGSRTYAIVAAASAFSWTPGGVQLIRVHDNATLEAADSINHNAANTTLRGARAVDTFEMAVNSTHTGAYAIVASSQFDIPSQTYTGGGVQLIRVHDNATLEAAGRLDTGSRGIGLIGAVDVDTFRMSGGRTYAIVAVHEDDAVQLIRVHENATLEAAGLLRDDTYLALDGASSISAFAMGNRMYAAVTAEDENGVQIVRVHENGTLSAAGQVVDGPGFPSLGGARSIDTLEVGGHTYAAVSSEHDDAVSLIRLSPASVEGVSTPLAGGTYPRGYPINVTVGFDAPVVVSGPLPSLLLDLGGRERAAEYLLGNGTEDFVFNYTVQPGDVTGGLEYAGPGALVIRGAAVDVGAVGTSNLRPPPELSPPGAIAVDFDFIDPRRPAAADPGLPRPGAPGSLGSLHRIAIDSSAVAYVTGVTSPNGDGAYGAGRTIYIDVEFSAPVEVAGEPLLALAVGQPRDAVYHSGGGTNVLTFLYEVQPGDHTADLEYAGTAALSLGGGAASIRDRSPGTADAVLGLPMPGTEGSLGASKNIEIDTAGPIVERVASPSAGGAYSTGRIVNITVAFNEPVEVRGVPVLGLATVPPRNATYASGAGTAELSFLYAVQPGDSAARLGHAGDDALSLGSGGTAAIRDAQGNAALLDLPAPGPGGLLAGRGDISIVGAKLPVLAAAGRAAADASLDFSGAHRPAVVEAGNRTYAVVTSYGQGAALLVRVHENGTLENVHQLEDNNSDRRLGGAIGVDAFGIGNRTFAVVASLEPGVQLLEVHPGNESLTALHSIGNSNNLELDGAIGVDAFGIGNRTFAVVAALNDDGVQLLEVHPGNGTLRAVDSLDIVDGGGLRLDGAAGVAAFEIGNRTYAAVASRDGGGVQVVRIHGNGTLEADSAHQIADGGALALAAPLAIDVVEIGNRTYAAVPARGSDNGVQLVRIHGNGTLEADPAHKITDTGELRLAGPHGIDSFEMGGSAYALVAARGDDGVQLVRLGGDGAPFPAGSAANGAAFPRLDGPHGIAVFGMAGSTYAMVASADGTAGVQLIRLTPASAANASLSLPDGAYGAGQAINITVGFDAPVSVSGLPPSLLLDFDGRTRAAEYLEGGGTERLVFNYTVRPGDNAGGGLEYAGPGALVTAGLVADAGSAASGGAASADLELPVPGEEGSLGYERSVRIDTPPLVESVYSPDAGGAYAAGSKIRITVAFTEAVRVTGAPLLGLSTDPPRSAEYVDGSDGDAYLEFIYTVQPGDRADRLDYANRSALSAGDGGAIRDATGNNAELALPELGSDDSLHASGIAVNATVPRSPVTPGGGDTGGDGGTPGGTPGGNGGGTPGGNGGGTPGGNGGGTPGGNGSAAIHNVTLVIGPRGIAGPANATDGAGGLPIILDIRGLAGAADGTATFPAGSVVVNASFASVAFPPGVTAMPVPADGLLVLHVVSASDGYLPSNSSIQRLAYGGSGPVMLQRIVEVGDADGRITFDMPVRISLEGQAGGRAFYIDGGANGTITPIDLACAADDTERVHRQLGGMGECRIDSGGDLAIHTYHLTRFGSVVSERGTPPPVVHTCSLRLDKTDLAVPAVPGAYSKAVRQAVVNSGSQPFDRVALDATPWYIDPVSDMPDTNAPSLPASLTVTSSTEEGGQFAPLPGAVADGLGGGQEEPLWLAINLTGHAQVNGTRLVQDVAYTAECGG